jgi:2-succinyl-6-hydroxy-2,4-cyclohexadiene-1-carboxylate synthase
MPLSNPKRFLRGAKLKGCAEVPQLDARPPRPGMWFDATETEDGGDDKSAGRCQEQLPLVLLLHGFSGTHQTWDWLRRRLAGRYSLLVPDLPGHGLSAGASSSSSIATTSLSASSDRTKISYSIETTADAIADLIRMTTTGRRGGGMMMRRRRGRKQQQRRVALVGYSLGGRVALDLATRYPELLSCLVLESASPGIEGDAERRERTTRDDALADEIEEKGIQWFVDYWQEMPLFATQKALPRSVLRAVRRDRLSNTPQGLAMSLRTMGAGRMVPLWDKLGDITLPVLIVVGTRDSKYVQLAEEMQRKMGRTSRLVKVEGAGHCVHLERPAEFADALEAFLTMTMTRQTMEGEKKAARGKRR